MSSTSGGIDCFGSTDLAFTIYSPGCGPKVQGCVHGASRSSVGVHTSSARVWGTRAHNPGLSVSTSEGVRLFKVA